MDSVTMKARIRGSIFFISTGCSSKLDGSVAQRVGPNWFEDVRHRTVGLALPGTRAQTTMADLGVGCLFNFKITETDGKFRHYALERMLEFGYYTNVRTEVIPLPEINACIFN